MNVLYLHNGIFLNDIIGYEQLKFSQTYTDRNEILGTPLLRRFRRELGRR